MIENEISNAELGPADIPAPDASRDEIERFALTFDAYGVWGSFARCAEIAEARRHDSLTNLRTCLFLEQRKMYWSDPAEPDDEQMAYVRSLIEKIRGLVTS